MRLIHTADWHLGRLFHNVHLTRDQEHVLEQLVALVAEVKPAAVLIAGDLYDRAVPPTEAVELLDYVLTEIVVGQGVPVVAIAGNHDSAVRLGFAASLLRERGLYLVGELPQAASPVVLRDEHGPVHVHPLPYADAAEARYAYADDAIHDQQAVAAAGVARALAATPPAERRVALRPRLRGRSARERERAPAECRRRHAGAGRRLRRLRLRRAGPPPPAAALWQRDGPLRRFAAQVLLRRARSRQVGQRHRRGAPGSADGDAGAAGRARVTVETVALTPRRDVRRLEGTLAELLERGVSDPRRDDYVLAALLDRGALLDPIGRLRGVYPNALSIERPLYETTGAAGVAPAAPGQRRRPRSLRHLLRLRHRRAPRRRAARASSTAVIDGLERRRREAPA